MRWLTRINKKKRGFTLIELMVVVIVVGILAAAAIPIYRFAMNRAYSSEAKATMGTIRSSELVYATENDTDGDPTNDYLIEESSDTATEDLMALLGVDTSTNTWWHTGSNDAPDTCVFGFGTGTDAVATCTNLTLDVPLNYHVYAIATGGPMVGVEIALDITTGKWYHYWP